MPFSLVSGTFFFAPIRDSIERVRLDTVPDVDPAGNAAATASSAGG